MVAVETIIIESNRPALPKAIIANLFVRYARRQTMKPWSAGIVMMKIISQQMRKWQAQRPPDTGLTQIGMLIAVLLITSQVI